MTPHNSEDLTTLIEKEGSSFIVLWSPDTAEHQPDYRELGRFPTEQQATDFRCMIEMSDEIPLTSAPSP